MREWIIGRNPVYEVLRTGRRQIFRLLIAQGVQEKGRITDLIKLAAERRITVEKVIHQQLDPLGYGHQGIALEVSGYPYSTLQDILEVARIKAEHALILILDQLQDPQNFGTLLRTAESTGVDGIILPLRHTTTVTPAVVSSSSGACEHLLITQANLIQAITQLKENGLWIFGLDGSPSSQYVERVNLDGPIAIVVGSEGEGLRSLVRESCDVLLSLPMQGNISSLNASVAGSIVLYLIWERRGWK